MKALASLTLAAAVLAGCGPKNVPSTATETWAGQVGLGRRTRTVTSPFDVKSAISRYGFRLLDLSVTGERHMGNRGISSTSARFVGVHAVLCAGYDPDGVWTLDSWRSGRGQGGFSRIGWNAFNRQLMYCAFSEGVYRDMA